MKSFKNANILNLVVPNRGTEGYTFLRGMVHHDHDPSLVPCNHKIFAFELNSPKKMKCPQNINCKGIFLSCEKKIDYNCLYWRWTLTLTKEFGLQTILYPIAIRKWTIARDISILMKNVGTSFILWEQKSNSPNEHVKEINIVGNTYNWVWFVNNFPSEKWVWWTLIAKYVISLKCWMVSCSE